MSFISGLAELEGLEQIVARAGSLQRTERAVGEAERASTVLSDHALDLGIAGRRQARSGAASADVPADSDLGGSRIADMLGNDRSQAGARRVGSEPIADTLGDAILSNPVIQDLPYRFQGLAVDAMKVHARALAEPLAKDSGAANVLAHHFGLRATSGEIKDVLEIVGRHGGVNEATPAIQQLSKMDPHDLKAESLLTQWSHPDDPLAHFSDPPARKVITPVDQAAAQNSNIRDVPVSRRDAVEDGVVMWARTIAHPLANGPEAAELLATRLADRADQNDVRSIDAMMRAAGSTEQGLDLVADVARYERNMSGVVPLADLPEGVPHATEPNGYWVPGVGYRQEGQLAIAATDEGTATGRMIETLRQAQHGAQAPELLSNPGLAQKDLSRPSIRRTPAYELAMDGDPAVARLRASKITADPVTRSIVMNPNLADLSPRELPHAVTAVQAKLDTISDIMGVAPNTRRALSEYLGSRLPENEVRRAVQGTETESSTRIGLRAGLAVEGDDIRAAKLLINTETKAASVNDAYLDLRSKYPWQAPTALRGLVAYAKAFAEPFVAEGTNTDLLVAQIANKASVSDMSRIMSLMNKSGVAEADNIQAVEKMARTEAVQYLSRNGGLPDVAAETSSLPAHASVGLGSDRQPLKILAASQLPVDGVNLAAASNIHVATLPLIHRSFAVNGVARYSRMLAQPAADPVSVEVLASKFASGLTKRQVSDAADTAVSHGSRDTKTVVSSELDRLTRQAEALEPSRLEEAGVADTAISRAAFLNPELRAVETQQPWKVAPTVVGLQQYARTFAAEVGGDVHSVHQISTLLAQTASPNDVWRIYNIMKTAKTQEGGLRNVTRMALDDYDGLLSRVEQPLSPTVVRRTFDRVPSELLDGTDGPVARALEPVKRGSEVDTAIPPVGGLPADVFLRPGETSAEPFELEFTPLPRETSAVLSPGRGLPADTSSSSARESAPRPRRARPGGAVKNPTPDGVEALAWDKP